MPDMPPDVLSQGRDRRPGPWPRRLTVLVILTVAVVAAVVHFRSHGSPASGRAHPVASPAASRAPVAVGQKAAAAGQGGAGAGPAEPGIPTGITGPTLRWDAGLRLPLTGAQPAWFSPGTGGVDPINGLPLNQAGYAIARVAGGWTVQAGSAAGPPCPGSCAGLPQPVYFLGDRARSVRPLGVADSSAPGTTPAALWLTSFRPGASLSAASAMAQEVGVTGRTIGRPVRLPAGQVVARATGRGLLLAPATAGPAAGTARLWDPVSGQFGRRFTGVIAASASAIAWTPRCAPGCQLHLLDLRTGASRVIGLRAGSSVTSGAFSTDGRYLALQVSFSSGGASAPAVELEVASAATGRVTVVPGTWASSDALVGFGWPAGTDRLVAELRFTTKVQLAAWRPGADELAVAVIAPGRVPAAMITG